MGKRQSKLKITPFDGKKNGTCEVIQTSTSGTKSNSFLWFNTKVPEYVAMIPLDEDGFYIGSIRNQKMNGMGSVYYPTSNSLYQGEWVDNYMHGSGTLKTPYFTYIGSFVFDCAHGKGRCIFLDGTYYVGEVCNNVLSGWGELYNSQDKLLYRGEWFQDTFHGRGEYFCDRTGQLIFRGNWKEGYAHGEGITYDRKTGYVISVAWYEEGEFQYMMEYLEKNRVEQTKKTSLHKYSTNSMTTIQSQPVAPPPLPRVEQRKLFIPRQLKEIKGHFVSSSPTKKRTQYVSNPSFHYIPSSKETVKTTNPIQSLIS